MGVFGGAAGSVFDLMVRFSADTSKLTTGCEQVTKKVDTVNNTLNNLVKGGLTALTAYLSVQSVKAFVNWGESMTSLNEQMIMLDSQAKNVGSSSDKLVGILQRATGWQMTMSDSAEALNKMMQTMGGDEGTIASMGAAAENLSDIMGTSVADAFGTVLDSINTLRTRGLKVVLPDLIDVDDLTKRLAEDMGVGVDQVDKATVKTALLNEVIKESQKISTGVANPFTQLKVALSDLADTMGLAIFSKEGEFNTGIEAIAARVREWTEWIHDNEGKMREWAETIVKLALTIGTVTIVSSLANALNGVITLCATFAGVSATELIAAIGGPTVGLIAVLLAFAGAWWAVADAAKRAAEESRQATREQQGYAPAVMTKEKYEASGWMQDYQAQFGQMPPGVQPPPPGTTGARLYTYYKGYGLTDQEIADMFGVGPEVPPARAPVPPPSPTGGGGGGGPTRVTEDVLKTFWDVEQALLKLTPAARALNLEIMRAQAGIRLPGLKGFLMTMADPNLWYRLIEAFGKAKETVSEVRRLEDALLKLTPAARAQQLEIMRAQAGIEYPGLPGMLRQMAGPKLWGQLSESFKMPKTDVNKWAKTMQEALLSGLASIVASIQSGDIGKGIQGAFNILGNAISARVAAMVSKEAGGGFGAKLLGGLAGGLVGIGIGLLGGLFDQGKSAGTTPANPVYTYVTNLDEWFQFGFTLPMSNIYSGRRFTQPTDPHGRGYFWTSDVSSQRIGGLQY